MIKKTVDSFDALIGMVHGPILPVYTGVLFMMVLLAVYQLNVGQGVVLISLFGPFLGVLWNLLGGLIRTPLYWFIGYWFNGKHLFLGILPIDSVG